MPQFYTGDELGKIKLINCTLQDKEWKIEEQAAHTPAIHAKFASGAAPAQEIKTQAVQRLTALQSPEHTVLAAGRSNGTLTTFSTKSDGAELNVLAEWKETRFKDGHSFVGLEAISKGLFWCTSNGALGHVPIEGPTSPISPYHKAILPMRLKTWRLSPDGDSFAYGGDEVDLSLWDTERAFHSSTPGTSDAAASSSANKKRKRDNDLLPGEIWRAKNLPNDSLNLRQPIHIKSLTYLSSHNLTSTSAHLVTGTETGDVRRYDTRAARRPVANWIGIGKVGGIGIVQAGSLENELFVSDNGSNLSALDLRNGRIIYSYKQLQGAITSVAPHSSGSLSNAGMLGSTCRDRFFRLHSTFPPPVTAGGQQDERGQVLGNLYLKTVPTAVVALSNQDENISHGQNDDDEMDDVDEDEVWARMDGVEDSEDDELMDGEGTKPKRKRKIIKEKA